MSESSRRLVRVGRLVALGLALGLLALAVMALRTAAAGREALAASERAFDAGELRESVRYAARAATLSVPSAGYVELAYRRLLVIARGAEAAGQPQLAAFAWDAVRGAAIESSAPGFGPRPELEQANQNLARLASQLANGGKDDPAAERELLKTLERPAGPALDGLLLLGGGMLLLFVGLCVTGLGGLRADGRANARTLLAAALLVALGAACWTAAAYRA
jgi:hypothetical protein